MPADGRYKNWSDVSFTPDGGVLKPITGVTDIGIDRRVQTIAGAGDADLGPSSKHVVADDPQITIEFDHIAALMTLVPGTRGSFRATRNDATNEEGTGAMMYVVSNCVIANITETGRYRQYATSRMVIETYRPDGRTHPIAITIAA